MTADSDLLQRLRAEPDLLQQIETDSGRELAIQRRLRDRWDSELVRAALALHSARTRASGILPQAEQLWLTAVGLEQATHPLVAAHKASRFPEGVMVYDLCSGIGSDAAALSRRGPVTAVDIDGAMLQRLCWNLDVWNAPPCETQQDNVQDIALSGKLIHADPDRRGERARPVRRLEQYRPDLTWMQQAVTQAAGGAIKIGPASNFIQKFPGCEIELISLLGECREATVWFGELTEQEQFRATVLPSGETICGDPLGAWAETADAPGRYLLDPDPAVVRSGLVDTVCERFALARLDPEEEYLTADERPDTSFVTAFEVETVLPNNRKQLRQHLRTAPAQFYEVKCRHVPIDAAAVARRLPTGGDEPKVLFFLRIQGRTKIVVARRLQTRTAARP